MKLDAGVEALPSKAGFIFSLILLIVVTGYAVQKTDILINRKDIDIMSVIKKDYYSEDEQFQHSQGLEFAVALTAYDGERESILDPSIGELIFETYEFGVDKFGVDKTYERYT